MNACVIIGCPDEVERERREREKGGETGGEPVYVLNG
jgi:hypothetical protein